MRVARHHLESLDALRGATVAAMIVVNNPGDWTTVFPALLHASWNGCTFADLVFPSFIFIMGVAMPYAFARRLERADGRAQLLGRVARRAAALVALGLVLNLAAAWRAPASIRLPGVLQRIGVVYLLSSFVVLRARPRMWMVWAVVLMMVHWALLLLVPFDSYAAGTLTYEHNVAGAVDRVVFGRHILTPFGDPEGILGTLTAIATALLGAIAGQLMREGRDHRTRVITVAGCGIVCVTCGLMWSRLLPLNKPLWTGSYALVSAGVAAIAFAVFYWIVDARGIRSIVRPFVWLGVNPLAIYFLSEMVGHVIDQGLVRQGAVVTTPKAWLFYRAFVPFAGDVSPAASLAFAVWYCALWLGVASVLYRRGIRVQV